MYLFVKRKIYNTNEAVTIHQIEIINKIFYIYIITFTSVKTYL